jgi:hypothetical protein
MAIVHIAMFDASMPDTGPTGLGDGNPDTHGDTSFSPLGAPASNLNGPNFTPPFPAYPSGHAGFGGTIFQIMRRFYGTDNIAFTFVSDEFNGQTRDNNGTSVRISRAVFLLCLRPRKKMARAGFISESTGPLIRPSESLLVVS